MGPDVLDAERPAQHWPAALASRRTRWLGGLAVALLLVVATAVLTTPPAPLRVQLAQVDGSALRGDSFLRLQLQLRGSGVTRLDEVNLRLAGRNSPGLSPRGFDRGGRAVVQVDVVPDCTTFPDLRGSSLQVTVLDQQGRPHTTVLPLPVDGVVQRLVTYRCDTA